MTTWSSFPDTAPETVEAVQAGLTVGLVMTERSSLMTCRPSDTVGSLVAGNEVDGFSYIPVLRNSIICGLYNAERWFGKTPPEPDARVEEDFEALSEDLLIGADVSIQEFVLSAAERPARLVVSGSEIVGLVCLADLHKLPVRAALFGLVTALEMVMTERIEDASREGPEDWLKLLSPIRRKKLEEKIVSLQKNDTFVGELLATDFADKVDIIVKRGLLEGSKTNLRKEFREIEKLRNGLAHASAYAATKDAAEKVPQTVETTLRFMVELRKKDVSCTRQGCRKKRV